MKKSFNEKCYNLLKKVPGGKVTTYKEIANILGTGAYRAVGNAMNKNPNIGEVPCHRVVNSNGNVGGYALGVKSKIELLRKENVFVRSGKVVDFQKKLFSFSHLNQVKLYK